MAVVIMLCIISSVRLLSVFWVANGPVLKMVKRVLDSETNRFAIVAASTPRLKAIQTTMGSGKYASGQCCISRMLSHENPTDIAADKIVKWMMGIRFASMIFDLKIIIKAGVNIRMLDALAAQYRASERGKVSSWRTPPIVSPVMPNVALMRGGIITPAARKRSTSRACSKR